MEITKQEDAANYTEEFYQFFEWKDFTLSSIKLCTNGNGPSSADERFMQWPAVHHLRSLELWVHLRLREKETDELKTGHFMAASTQYTYDAPLIHISIGSSDFWSTNDANDWLCSIASRCSTKEYALLLQETALNSVGNRAYWLANSDFGYVNMQ